jgi:hypothetical protein
VRRGEPRGRRDAWRFLTPEVEREAPTLVAALGGQAGPLRARLEALVVHGREHEWFAALRTLRGTLEAAARRGGDRRTAHRLALILLEQYLLAPSVHELDAADEAELTAVRRLVAELAPAAGETDEERP